MSLWRIAWRSIEQRRLASLLTTLSMALGVMMVVAVLSIYGVVAESFRSNSSLGYNMIVGAKGGRLQLTLNTVYYLSQPVENVPYDFYLEFLPAAKREAELKNSIRYQVYEAQRQALFAQSLASGAMTPSGPAAVSALLSQDVLQQAQIRDLDINRDGKYSQFTTVAIPLCLGDYFGQFRGIGTTPDMFDQLRFGPESNRQYEFAAGRNFEYNNQEHGFFEAVVGAKVAREMKLQIGDTFSPTHGDPDGAGHGNQFTVVGILKSTGTPNDRAVFVNMEGFYLMDDHAKPLEEEEEYDDQEGGEGDEPSDHHLPNRRLPVEQREVTAILVRTIMPVVTPVLQNSINEGPDGQAVLPIRQIYSLFELIVKPIQLTLLGLTALICLVSGISILVSIYNSMSDRKHEIAVMRALGASRGTVMTVILLESVLLSLGGGALGWMGGHALNAMASSRIESQTGVTIGFWDMAPPIENLELWGMGPIIGTLSPEMLIVPALIVLAVIVGFLPAVAAYRTDVAKSLSS